MSERFLYTAICLLAGSVLSAQNLDPTVEVTSEYVAKHVGVNKPMIEMAVPDTVMRFDIDFDYSVTSTPYKGSYSFEPYALDVRPQPTDGKDKVFFLRLGAGWSLHPVADVVITPRFKSRAFSMSLYGSHRSYFGKYRTLGAQSEDGKIRITWDKDAKPRFSGYDTYTTAGILGRSEWTKGLFSFDIGYTGYARKDTSLRRNYDVLRADLRLASHNSASKYFYYDIGLTYRYGQDNVTPRGAVNPVAGADGKSRLTGHDFDFFATLGSVFSSIESLLFDVRLELHDYGSYFSSRSGKFTVGPRYTLRSSRWMLNLGANFSTPLGDDDTDWTAFTDYSPAKMHKTDGQYVYPDVEIGYDLVKDALNMYAKATGGVDCNSYYSMVQRNPFLTLGHAWNYAGAPLMSNTIECINLAVGFKGSIGSKFSFDLRGGYARDKGMLLDAIVIGAVSAASDSGTSGATASDDGTSGAAASGVSSSGLASSGSASSGAASSGGTGLAASGSASSGAASSGSASSSAASSGGTGLAASGSRPSRAVASDSGTSAASVADLGALAPTVVYSNTNRWYAALDIFWRSRDVTADASILYNGTDIVKFNRPGFEPSPLLVGANVVYNWRQRIYVGLHCNAALYREGYGLVMDSGALECGDTLCRIPGYFDLGLSLEYKFSSKVSFWLYGSNLLNQTIQRSALYSASGINLTGGIAVVL